MQAAATSQIAHLSNGRGNGKCNVPIHRHDFAPGHFARLRSKAGNLEEVHEYVCVNDFNADVATKQGRDKAGGGTKRVYYLPSARHS